MQSELYNGFVEDFHSIVEQEYIGQDLLVHKEGDSPAAGRLFLMTVMLNTNSSGVMNEEFRQKWLIQYHNDEIFRRIWGSVSIRVEAILEWKYATNSRSLMDMVQNVASLASAPENSFTNPDVANERLIGGIVGHGDRIDFWLYCLAFFRITIGDSAFFHERVQIDREQKIPAARKSPDRVKKDTLKHSAS